MASRYRIWDRVEVPKVRRVVGGKSKIVQSHGYGQIVNMLPPDWLLVKVKFNGTHKLVRVQERDVKPSP